jgi:hypothetical protein
MAQSNIPNPAALPWIDGPTEAAFAAILPEIQALPDTAVLTVNIDVVAAATTVLGLLPELRALRPQIVDEFSRFDLERFDKLEQYALALSHAHGLYRGAASMKRNTAELAAEVTAARDRLLSCARTLATHGLLEAARLTGCKTTTAYRATASDIFMLVPLFKEHWSRIRNNTPLTLSDLNRASNLAVELLTEVGLKEQAPVGVNAAAQIRAKAYTLLADAYEDARRAVQYLRARHGDAHDIAPSLYAGRGGRGNKRCFSREQCSSPRGGDLP